MTGVVRTRTGGSAHPDDVRAASAAAPGATGARPFFLFSPNFSDFALAILERMASLAPGLNPCGLAIGGGSDLRKLLADHPLVSDAPIDDLGELEHRWLRTEVADADRSEVLRHFSHTDLRRILIADRQVGAGYVTGAIQRDTPLIRKCYEEGMLERYLWNLCGWVIEFHESSRFDRAFCYALAGAPAVALAIYCRNRGIPFRKFTASRLPNRFVVDSLIDDSLDFGTDVNSRSYPDVTEADRRFALDFLSSFRDRPIRPDYEHRSRARLDRRVSLKTIAANLIRDAGVLLLGRFVHDTSNLRRPTARARLTFHWKTSVRARRLHRRWPYQGVQDLDGHDYAFYPMHVDPEASTMMLAPMFTNQVAVVEAFSKALPLGMKLIVKEHAPMLGRRPPGFYDQIAALPGVVLLPPTVDNFSLMREAELVAVITGTAAWEALLLGGRAVMLGSAPFSRFASGLVRCTDLEKLPEAVEMVLSADGAEHEDLIAHLAAVHARSFEYDLWHRPLDSLDASARDEILDFIAERILEDDRAENRSSHDG